VTIGFGRRELTSSLSEPSAANASADLISFLQAIPEGLMQWGCRQTLLPAEPLFTSLRITPRAFW
jgi:hypothetical protein